jgi:hypothetical protein
MASIRKRGGVSKDAAYQISVSMGYDANGKAEKLAREYAALWESKIRGFISLDENRTFAELFEWFFSTVAPRK